MKAWRRCWLGGDAFGISALEGKENAVTFVRIRAESINLIQNHPLCSYKHARITQGRSRRAQTPTGPSG